MGPTDKVLLVGPNNSGKSLALREVVNTVSQRQPNFNSNLIIKNILLKKEGKTQELRDFLEDKGEIHDETIRYLNWQVYRNLLPDWDRLLLGHLAAGFIKSIAAEDRLTITSLQSSISPGQQKSVPQHVLYDDELLMDRISTLFHKSFGSDLFFDFRGGSTLPMHVGTKPKQAVAEGEDRVSDSYVAKVRANPLLHEQGDGIKSYAGLLFEAVATERDITLVDEPEAFLHPPQMRRLGETLAGEVVGQLLVATHSSDIMRGFLTGTGGSVRILRIQRNGDVNEVTEAPIESVKSLWEQPVLRYSNALEGVFHEQVIICEDDSDCRLFNSVADFMEQESGDVWKDTAYIPAGGKHGIPRIAKVLYEIGVPIIAVFDIDFLSDSKLVKDTIEALGGDWADINTLWRRVSAAVRNGIAPLDNQAIKASIREVLDSSKDDELPKGDIIDILKWGNPWAQVKKYGVDAIPRGQAQEDFQSLYTKLRGLGIFVVQVGEVENFCREIGKHGPRFVNKLLQEIPIGDGRLVELRDFVEEVHRGAHVVQREG